LPGGTEFTARMGLRGVFADPAGPMGGTAGGLGAPPAATGGTGGTGLAGEAGAAPFPALIELETRVGGTPNRLAGSGCCTPPIVSPSAALTAPLGAIGFPQSMQNFEDWSFSRPQTAQRIVTGCEAEREECGEYRAATTTAGEGNRGEDADCGTER
jgi:hypothetical protein